jgi:LysM repeat protein
MNNQSPLVPQSSLGEQKNSGRARVKVAVFVVLAIHGIGLLALLMQGCKRSGTGQDTASQDLYTNAPPIFEERTNIVAQVPSEVTNNAPIEYTNLPPITATTPLVDTTQPTVITPPVVTGGTDHKIAKGDNFSTLAKKYGVSVNALRDANPGLEPTRLQVGQVIHIPAPSMTAASVSTTGSVRTANGTYKVQSGDTLIRIASKYGVTAKELRLANNLKTDRIKVGQQLRIPSKTSAGSTSHTDTAVAQPH